MSLWHKCHTQSHRRYLPSWKWILSHYLCDFWWDKWGGFVSQRGRGESCIKREREGMGHVDEYNHVTSCRFMSCHVMYNNYGVFFYTRGILALMSDAGGLMRWSCYYGVSYWLSWQNGRKNWKKLERSPKTRPYTRPIVLPVASSNSLTSEWTNEYTDRRSDTVPDWNIENYWASENLILDPRSISILFIVKIVKFKLSYELAAEFN